MGKFSHDQFEVTQYLGNQVGMNNKFMKEISCMSQKYRVIYGCLEIIGLLDKNMSKQDSEDVKTCKEIIQKLGQSDWQMDIISHLSMKAGKGIKQHDAKL